MADTRVRKLLGDLRAARGRLVLVAGAIALAFGATAMLLDTWLMVRSATERGFLASLPVSATLRLDRADAAAVALARARDDVAAARARRLVSGAIRSGAGWTRTLLHAHDDFARADIARLRPEQGGWPPRDGEIAIERSALELAGATLGDEVLVSLPDGEAKPLRFSVVLRDVSQAPAWMEHVVYGYVTAATLEALGAKAGFDQLEIRVRDPAADRDAVRRTAYALKAELERQGYAVRDVEVPVPGEHVHAAQMDSLLMTQGAFAALTLVVALFLVVNLVNAMLARQVREIGVMKVLGGSPAQIAAIYLGFALVLGLLATLVAVPGAYLAARPYAAFKAELLNFPDEFLLLPAWAIPLQLALGLALPVVAAAWPVARGCRIAVGAALRDVGIAAADGGLRLARRVASGAGRPLLLALDNAFRRRQRLVLTLLALGAGGAVFLGAQNLKLAVQASVDEVFRAQRYDFSVRVSPAQPVERLEAEARAVEGADAAEAWSGVRTARVHEDGTSGNTFTVIGLPADTALMQPKLIDGRWLAPDDKDALVVTRGLLRDEPGLRPGKQVTLEIDHARSTWTIAGIVDSGPQPFAYAPRAAVAARNGGVAGTLAVRSSIPGEGAQLDLIRRLRERLDAAGMPVAGSQRLAESRRVLEDHLLMVVEFLGAMGWVMVAVGGLGLGSTLGLAVLERTRELGILRAIGGRDGQVAALVAGEGLAIALLAWLIAVPLSVPMSQLLGEAFGRVMFTVPARWWPAPGAVLAWLGLALAVALLASLGPARRAARLPVARALGYE